MSGRDFAVLGAGSWGTTLAVVLARNGVRVRLWGRDAAAMRALAERREDLRYLPGVELPAAVAVTTRLDRALAGAPAVLVVVPSHAFRDILTRVLAVAPAPPGVAWATKGFEPETGRPLPEVAAELLPPGTPAAVLSGPTFAAEIAAGLPAALTVAATDAAFARTLSEALGSARLRVYTSDDVLGVAVGGAVKNVLAIAAGIADALGFGANARAALIARGLHELGRLGLRLGARRETLMGLAGLGDVVLSCTDDQSRNRRLGLAIGRGVPLDAALAEIGQVVEGVRTVEAVMRLAARVGVEMPIAEQVQAVLAGRATPLEAVECLFAREVGPEYGG